MEIRKLSNAEVEHSMVEARIGREAWLQAIEIGAQREREKTPGSSFAVGIFFFCLLILVAVFAWNPTIIAPYLTAVGVVLISILLVAEISDIKDRHRGLIKEIDENTRLIQDELHTASINFLGFRNQIEQIIARVDTLPTKEYVANTDKSLEAMKNYIETFEQEVKEHYVNGVYKKSEVDALINSSLLTSVKMIAEYTEKRKRGGKK